MDSQGIAEDESDEPVKRKSFVQRSVLNWIGTLKKIKQVQIKVAPKDNFNTKASSSHVRGSFRE